MPQRRPGPQEQGGVGVGGADDAFGNEIVNLPAKGRLQTIGDMSGQFLVQSDRPFPHGRVEFRDALDRLFGGLRAADDLDQRHQVGRVERMPDDAALGVRRRSPIGSRSW